MKLVKSLLLGSAAGLCAVAGAQAADLPVRKAAPVAVEYVRVCSAYGAGYFFIPGTETCLRISGQVRAQYSVVETYTRNQNLTGFVTRGRLNVDARTQTAFGTLRAHFRYIITYGGNPDAALDFSVLNKAFIQFGPITAGRATSFFDFYANDLGFGGLPTGSDTFGRDPVVLAYTATFAPGFTASISLEDPGARRVIAGGAAAGTFAQGFAGNRLPEIVANIRADQAWGSAQLAGAVHQIYSPTIGLGQVAANDPRLGLTPDTEYGFALSAGVKLNLPFIAPGDVLWLQATYAEGAVNYLGVATGGLFSRVGGSNIERGNALNFGGVNTSIGDAFVDGFGNVRKTEGYVLTAAFLHYWTPQIRQSVQGSYGRIENASVVTTPLVGNFRPAGSVVDTSFYFIGTTLIYSPVRDLDIGVEVLYRNVDPAGRIADVTRPGRTIGSEDGFEARLRIQREF